MCFPLYERSRPGISPQGRKAGQWLPRPGEMERRELWGTAKRKPGFLSGVMVGATVVLFIVVVVVQVSAMRLVGSWLLTKDRIQTSQWKLRVLTT